MNGVLAWDREVEARRMVEVTFELPRRDWHHMLTESLWAEQVGPDLFVLRNSPFYVEGVSFLDTVRAERRGPEWFFVEVHAASGHSTYRLFRTDRSVREPWSKTLAPLKRLGCAIEGADERWAVVDVPAAADIHAVLTALQRGDEEGRWQFAESHCGHPKA